ncbi:MAG: PTS transporter subunit EIIC [Erysipelotrichaceae bacterium]|nr:PTS transporter subunit EIIC [Erysipelotrichaceae bacterium]
MNILVVCAAGMSSSALVAKMRNRIAERNLENMKVGSCASFELDTYAIQADVILLAPQLSFMEEKCRTFQPQVFVLEKEAYGLLDADSVIDMILSGEKKKTSEEITHKQHALMEFLQNLAGKVRTNPVISSITRGMTMVLPVTVCGALFSLVANLPVNGYTELIEKTGLKSLFTLGYDMTLGMISVYLICTISFSAARGRRGNTAGAVLSSLAGFFMFAVRSSDGVLDLSMMGPSGVFTAMIAAVSLSFLFLKLHALIPKNENIKGLPENVQASFLSLIPFLICASLSVVTVLLVRLCGFSSPAALIESTVQKVIAGFLGNSVSSYLGLNLVASILWFFGIHGGNVIGALTDPVYLSLSLENIRAFQAQQPPVNIINNGLSSAYYFGGIGSTLSLAVLCAFFAKSQKIRTVGRISLPMGIFFINEPLLFGLPIILNMQLLIPFIFIPFVSGALTLTLMKAGILPYTIGFPLPWTTPPIVTGFIQGGWRLALWQVILLVLQAGMWYPFFKAMDKEEEKSEKGDSL